MKQQNYIISITLLLLNTQIEANSICLERQEKIKFIIRGKYQNVLNLYGGALISSKNENGFPQGNESSCLRNNIYIITCCFGFTWNLVGQQMIFDLQQQYELNTLKIWLWDQDNRYYRIKVYLIFKNVETKIYESNLAQSMLKIKFPSQQVEKFKIVNVNGNTYNSELDIIKIESYYQFDTTI